MEYIIQGMLFLMLLLLTIETQKVAERRSNNKRADRKILAGCRSDSLLHRDPRKHASKDEYQRTYSGRG